MRITIEITTASCDKPSAKVTVETNIPIVNCTDANEQLKTIAEAAERIEERVKMFFRDASCQEDVKPDFLHQLLARQEK